MLENNIDLNKVKARLRLLHECKSRKKDNFLDATDTARNTKVTSAGNVCEKAIRKRKKNVFQRGI